MVGNAGTILKTSDRGSSWEDITSYVIQRIGTNLLANGRRLNEVNLHAVRHARTGDEVTVNGNFLKYAQMVLVVGDYSTILRYDPCATLVNNLCVEASDAWIDEKKTKVGYEVSFTRYFYKPPVLRSLEEIRADIAALEQETEGLLQEIVGGVKQ